MWVGMLVVYRLYIESLTCLLIFAPTVYHPSMDVNVSRIMRDKVINYEKALGTGE